VSHRNWQTPLCVGVCLRWTIYFSIFAIFQLISTYKTSAFIFLFKNTPTSYIRTSKMSSSSSAPVVESAATSTDVTPVVSLTERITKVEELLKELKRAAKQLEKQVGRRRRRVPRGQKGETPQQLRAWHEEVHRVWEDMKKADKTTLYKKAVAEAARRRGATPSVGAAATPVVAAPVVVAAPATKGKRAAKATA